MKNYSREALEQALGTALAENTKTAGDMVAMRIMLEQRIRLAEEARYKAEARCEEMARELGELRARIPRAEVIESAQVGGWFRLRAVEEMRKSPLVKDIRSDPREDAIFIERSREAVYSGLCYGTGVRMYVEELMSKPAKVHAHSWWHLCAKLGVTEFVARVMYANPEEGQPSAAEKAKPLQRGPVITCQGDWFEDHEG